MSQSSCIGCAQSQRRFRSTTPRLWCQRHHSPVIARCLDYRTKRSAIQIALDYVRRSFVK